MDPEQDQPPVAAAVEVAWQVIGLATAVLALYMTWAAVRRDPQVVALRRRISAGARRWWERQQDPRRVVSEAMRVLLEEGSA